MRTVAVAIVIAFSSSSSSSISFQFSYCNFYIWPFSNVNPRVLSWEQMDNQMRTENSNGNKKQRKTISCE